MRRITLVNLITTLIIVQLFSPISSSSQDTLRNFTPNDREGIVIYKKYLSFNQQQIQGLPFRKLSTFGLLAPSAYRLKGDRMCYYGLETSGNHTYVDGMQVTDASDFPIRIIQSYELFTREAPINLGFGSGAITSILTIDNQEELTVSFDINTDQSYSSQGYSGEFFINIPISSVKKNDRKKQVPSLLISGKYSWTNNPDPVWKRTQKLDPEKLADLMANPLRPPISNNYVEQNAEFVTSSDMIDQMVPDNSSRTGIYPYIKLVIPVSKNIDLNIGNYSVIDEGEIYNNDNSIFNSVNNATRIRRNYDSYISWNHNIDVNEELSLNYDINIQYSNHFQKVMDKRHGDNFFDYGYLGKFTSYKMPTYELGSDTVDGQYYENVWLLNSWDYDTLVTFAPSNINPALSAYTSNYYDIYDGYPQGHYQNMDDILLGGGRINGMASPSVYGLYNNTGSVTAGYFESRFEKIRAAFHMGADYKSHSFVVGGEYNNDRQSHFSVSPNGLWNLIRDGKGLTNFHLRELDRDNPILVVNNGHVDTIKYARKYDANSQREFDKNLRIALGLPVDGVEYIITDSYDRENNTIDYFDSYGNRQTINTPDNFLSLGMFSPGELLNEGFSLVNYAGYSYDGNRQKENIDPYLFFEDFSIAASNPEYWSVFIQDEFSFENLRVRLGLRVDVYDARRPVLIDEYSLFPINNAKETSDLGVLVFDKPNNIGDDYLVYVDKVRDPTRVVGYRNGDNWYTNEGVEISDPTILDVGSGISPYLAEPDIYSFDDEEWNPEMTFKDYSRSVNLLPQISLDYTIINRINIYTNYSSFTSNPSYYSDFRPDQYYYFHYYSNNQILSNPALVPMRAGKFFTGIRGRIWKNIIGDISYLNTTIDNYISAKKFVGAYPNSYVSLSNEGARVLTQGFEASIEMTSPTGSGLTGGVSFTRLFSDNEVYITNYISNMVINSNLQYRFGRGDNFKGPRWLSEKIFQGFSAGVYYQHRHGMPYIATRNNYFYDGIEYTPNINLFNLNVQKDFVIGGKAMINIYLIVENLFNFKNVFDVYSDTGKPDDDGYLSSYEWQNEINQQTNPDSYRLLYQLGLYNPQHYDIPRIWRVGLTIRY